MAHNSWYIGSERLVTSLEVLIEVDAALTEGDYKFNITKNGRAINRLLIQDETLIAEYTCVFQQYVCNRTHIWSIWYGPCQLSWLPYHFIHIKIFEAPSGEKSNHQSSMTWSLLWKNIKMEFGIPDIGPWLLTQKGLKLDKIWLHFDLANFVMRNSTAKFDPRKGSNAYAPKNIQLKDNQGNRLLLNYHGKGNLTADTRLKLTFDGLALTSTNEQEPKTTPFTESPADFVVIQTNKCDICVNGKYLFDESSHWTPLNSSGLSPVTQSTQRIGYFEFKGIVVYHAKFPKFRQTKFYTTFRRWTSS